MCFRHFTEAEQYQTIMTEKKKATFDPEVKEPKEESESAEDEALETKTSETETETESSEEEDDKEEEGDDEDEDEEVTPENVPVRKSTQQHIINRQSIKIKKLRSKKDEESVDEEDDDELSSEASNAVSKEVKRQVAPVIDALVSTTDDQELKDLYTSEPAAKKYDKRIKSYMKSEHWKGVPVSAIFHHLAFKDAEFIGKERKRIADKEADLNKGGGRQLKVKKAFTGKMPSAEEIEGMDPKAFEQLQLDVKRGKYLKK